MTITLLSLTGLLVSLILGWTIGQLATKTASETLHLPVRRLGNLLPILAALALSGGLSLGAWQASEAFFKIADEQPTSNLQQPTTCSHCSDQLATE